MSELESWLGLGIQLQKPTASAPMDYMSTLVTSEEPGNAKCSASVCQVDRFALISFGQENKYENMSLGAGIVNAIHHAEFNVRSAEGEFDWIYVLPPTNSPLLFLASHALFWETRLKLY